MVRTLVGYAGGTTPNPTYRELGDHSETLRIEYDPARITYPELLDVFWNSHSPLRPPFSRQYMSAVFYHDAEQRRQAEENLERRQREIGARLFTEIRPAGEFFPAEDYHQKYRLRQDSELMREFEAIYPEPAEFAASTAAARVNGLLAGYGTRATLEAEIGLYGLSEGAQSRLREAAAGLRAAECTP